MATLSSSRQLEETKEHGTKKKKGEAEKYNSDDDDDDTKKSKTSRTRVHHEKNRIMERILMINQVIVMTSK